MNLLIGFLLICVAITFFVAFVMGDSLIAKEKLRLALSIIAFLFVIALGAYLIDPYIS